MGRMEWGRTESSMRWRAVDVVCGTRCEVCGRIARAVSEEAWQCEAMNRSWNGRDEICHQMIEDVRREEVLEAAIDQGHDRRMGRGLGGGGRDATYLRLGRSVGAVVVKDVVQVDDGIRGGQRVVVHRRDRGGEGHERGRGRNDGLRRLADEGAP